MAASKDQILSEIRRTAMENGGQPLGTARFERETGIRPYDWERYWPRFGDAQREAGFIPNQLRGAHADELVFQKLALLVRKLKKFPTSREIDAERSNDPDLPTKKVFQRHGTKQQQVQKLLDYCGEKRELGDVAEICRAALQPSSDQKFVSAAAVGEVYLMKSGRFYKIGRTIDTVRRGRELQIQLPEKMDLIHSIKTDDPSGVEAYWHKRFEAHRMQGEWFDLRPADVAAFKRWRRIH